LVSVPREGHAARIEEREQVRHGCKGAGMHVAQRASGGGAGRACAPH
jgi:cell division GTPase FtsZ